MRTAFDIDPNLPLRYPLRTCVASAHDHLHALPDAHRLFVVGGPRHEHHFHAAVHELAIDSARNWRDERTPNRIPRLSEGFIYATRYDGQPGRVKIGRTSKLPEQRLADLERRTAAPGSLELLYAFQTPMVTDLEGALHRAHGHLRRKGEWFNVTPAGLLASVLGAAAGHKVLRAECRVWMTGHALSTATPDDLRLLRAAGLGRDPDEMHAMTPPGMVPEVPRATGIQAG